jgi:hypothetical protein
MNGEEMDRRSVEKMKLDRRLIGRRGWIADKDLQRELDQLPDVSDKIATEDEGSDSAGDVAADSTPDNPVPAVSTDLEFSQQPESVAPSDSFGLGPKDSDPQ